MIIVENCIFPLFSVSWHDKDVNRKRRVEKKHHAGAFFFESSRATKQVSRNNQDKLNGPAHERLIPISKGSLTTLPMPRTKDKSANMT